MSFRLRNLPADTITLLALFLACAELLLISPFRLAWAPERAILGAATVLGALAWFYSGPRRNSGLALMAGLGYRLILFTDAAATINYLLDGVLPLPLQDARLAGADAALGLDWLSLYNFTTSHSALNMASNIIYNLLGPELIFLVLLLAGLGQTAQAVGLWRNFATTALITICAGVFIPATGPFAYYHLPIAAKTGYVVQYAALRDGSLRLINLANAQGLVSFPSFHACLAVICAFAARSLNRARHLFYLLNLLIVAVSPAIGGHYFVDIMAGLLLGALAVTAEFRLNSRFKRLPSRC